MNNDPEKFLINVKKCTLSKNTKIDLEIEKFLNVYEVRSFLCCGHIDSDNREFFTQKTLWKLNDLLNRRNADNMEDSSEGWSLCTSRTSCKNSDFDFPQDEYILAEIKQERRKLITKKKALDQHRTAFQRNKIKYFLKGANKLIEDSLLD